jgi:ribosome biogenesis GTPase / thiamine phosphate phosphatase
MAKRRNRVNSTEITRQYRAGDLSDHDAAPRQQFSRRSKFNQQNKTARTAQMRADNETLAADLLALPQARVKEFHSLFCQIEFIDPARGKQTQLAIVKKTLQRVSDTRVVVGDIVRVRDVVNPDPGGAQVVIEHVEPRKTLLTRADSFKAIDCHPIVANADQVLIVASIAQPVPKWGLIDRMILAAQLGELDPVVCLNKLDLDEDDPDAADDLEETQYPRWRSALAHYQSMGIRTLATCTTQQLGLDDLRNVLRGKTTVLAGHSGVGKSSLVRAIAPQIDLRVGEISQVNQKGKHTTTSAKEYELPELSARVVDTPGVKLFGLWNLTVERLGELFADIDVEPAPLWRKLSYQRIAESLG